MVATLTLQERILDDCIAVVQGLNLQSLTGATGHVGGNVHDASVVGDVANLVFPCVLVYVPDEPEEDDADSNFEQDGVVYAAFLAILDRESMLQANPTPRPDYLRWRHDIAQQLRSLVSLPSCPEVWDVRVRGRALFERTDPVYQFVRSSLSVKLHTSENRLGRP